MAESTLSCVAKVDGDRIIFLIDQNDEGYDEFSSALHSLDREGAMSWYGDTGDEEVKSGLILTTKPKE